MQSSDFFCEASTTERIVSRVPLVPGRWKKIQWEKEEEWDRKDTGKGKEVKKKKKKNEEEGTFSE